jgi:iron complex outermembrane receptor protein
VPLERHVVPCAVAAIATAAFAAAAQRVAAQSAAITLPAIHIVAPKPVKPKHPHKRARPVRPTVAIRRAARLPTPVPAPSPVLAPLPPALSTLAGANTPANAHTLSAADFTPATSPDLLSAMERALPGVALSNQTGNAFRQDVNYRGYIASPVIGTPQGLAVYQNGVRINEAFGDVVNWDFIPQDAIAQMTLVPSNPIYGLNAIGGALSLQMKNGFSYHGAQAELSGGSYGRIGTSVQAGGQKGNRSGYVTADAIDDAGWRQDSPSQLRRLYADAGIRGDGAEFHFTFTGADNHFGAAAATPVQMLDRDWSSVYTIPQTTHNQLAMWTASASWKPSATLEFQAVAYYRYFQQAHVDGNGTNAKNTGCPDPALVCFPNLDGTLSNLIATTGSTVPATGALAAPSLLGEIDRTSTRTNSFGGSAQIASSADLFNHGNNFVAGLSVDRGLVTFAASSELGVIGGNPPYVTGAGFFIDQPSGDVAPVGLGAQTLYTGVYATDTFDATKRLALTAGARFNTAQVTLTDEFGDAPALGGSHAYSHFNPMIGATYKVTPSMTLYGDYAIANRAPTPLELGCSDPARPCLIDNALVGDPNLQQVVSYTGEAGVRGRVAVGTAQVNWILGAYRALNTSDIIDVASSIPGAESFENAGNTLREGIEAGAAFKWDRWNVYANYTSVDATFRNYLTLASPFNPYADAKGNILVVPGDHIGGIPDYRFKLGAEYRIADPWTFGADLNVIGSQYLVGDESNRNPQVPAYWVVNLHSSYNIAKHLELFGQVNNVFDRHFAVYGTFFDVATVPYLNLTDPRTFVPGMPFAFYLGARATL